MSNGSNDNKSKQISLFDGGLEIYDENKMTESIKLNKSNDLKQENSLSVNQKPDELLFEYVSQLIKNLTTSSYKKDTELAYELDISISQMRVWLKRLVNNKVMVKRNKPVKYIWKE